MGRPWEPRLAEHNKAGLADALVVTVNLGMDWASPNSRRGAAADSMGPISLYLADVPPQLRSAFCCTMIVGITPGPKEPKAKNLQKNLLPLILQLRAAALHGLWVRTPKHPSGEFFSIHGISI